MKKKYILLLLFTLSLAPFALSQQQIYVDASNTTGTEDGTGQHPYNTIKEGVAAATAGSNIMISAGNYYPDSTWNEFDNALYIKPGIDLTGEGMANTIIHGVIVDWDQGNLPCSLEGLSFLEYHFNRGPSEGPFDLPNVIRNCHAGVIKISHSPGFPVGENPGPIYSFLIGNNDLGMDGTIEFTQGAGNVENRIQNNNCGYIYIFSGAGYTYLVDNNDVQNGIMDASGACNTKISNNRIINGAIIDKSGGSQDEVEDQFIENNLVNCNENAPILMDEDDKAAIIARPRSVTIRNNIITCSGNVSGISSKSGGPFHVIGNTITVDDFMQPATDPDEAVCAVYTKAGWGYVRGNTIQGGHLGYYSKAGAVDFSGNSITGSYTGFLSSGAEEVHHNTIKECHGDGMILNGLGGPVHNNVIKDNTGSGIRVLRMPIDLGGGQDTCPGLNVITGNGNYDLYIESISEQHPMLFARFNVWDHSDPVEIMLYDIRDGTDSTGLVNVDFNPVGYLGVSAPVSVENLLMYPNPAISVLNIEFPGSLNEPGLLSLFNTQGRMAQQVEISTGETSTINIGHLPAGIYFCRITTGNSVIVKKIVRQ